MIRRNLTQTFAASLALGLVGMGCGEAGKTPLS